MRNIIYLTFTTLILLSCDDIKPFKFSPEKERTLQMVISIIDSSEFRGSIYFKDKITRNLNSDIVKCDFSIDSISNYVKDDNFTRIVSEDNFVYFVIDGFSGTSFGLVYTKNKNLLIKDFYDVDTLSSSSLGLYKWYFASTKKY